MSTPLRRPLVAGMVLLTAVSGCGEPPGGAGAPPRTPASSHAGPSGQSGGTGQSAPPSAGPEETAVTVTVTKGKVRTAHGRVTVRRGATVRVTVTSDAPDEFHLHGYDRTLELRPGRPAVLSLVADKPGVFEAELHHTGGRVFELQVD